MNVIGTPTEWVDLIDTLVPDILDLVASSWADMPTLAADAREDPTTVTLCKLLRMNRDSADLPLQIQIQMVELDPAADEDQGRMDVAFLPLVPRENIYFTLECKRLNVVRDGQLRRYATEYVVHGVTRFVNGQYARVVRHGGMLGYVLDGDVDGAMQNVEKAVRARHALLGMQPPGDMRKSSILPGAAYIRETRHIRQQNAEPIDIHHLFMSRSATTQQPQP